MEILELHEPPRRARNLTTADIEEIVKHFQDNHVCRFRDVTTDDMSFAKDMLAVYKETRSEVIKWIVRGIIYGMLTIMAIVVYWKMKGAH